MKKIVEFELGLVGCSLGIIASLMAIFIEGTSILSEISESTIITNALISLVLSIFGIIGSIIVANKVKLAGILLIVVAVIGFICIIKFYILPCVLLLIAGLMYLLRKDTILK